MLVLRILRFIANKILLFILSSSIFLTVSVWMFFLSFGNRAVWLQWLDDSGAYDNVTSALIDTIEQSTEEEALNQVNGIDVDKLINVATDVYDGPFIKGQTEGAVNGVFDWLEDKTDEPMFTLSLKGKSDEFRSALGVALTEQINELPVCTQQDLNNFFEVGKATCRPPGINISREVDRAITQVGISDNDDESLLEAEATADDLFTGPIDVDREGIKSGYQAANTARYAFLAVILLFAVLAFFTAKSHRRGMQLVSSVFMSVGITTVLGGVAFSLSSILQDSVERGDNQEIISTVLLPVTEQVTATIARLSYFFGGGLIVFAFILWAIAHWGFKKPEEVVQNDDETINLNEAELPAQDEQKQDEYLDTLSHTQTANHHSDHAHTQKHQTTSDHHTKTNSKTNLKSPSAKKLKDK